MPLIVLETLLFAWVYTSTDRSILAVLLFDGMMNLTGKLLGISPAVYPFVVSGYALVAGVLVAWWHRGPRTPAPRPARRL